MRQSEIFFKTIKEAPKDEVSLSAQLLLRAGFVDKLMAGSYTFLPFGFRVLSKIEGIVREELNKTGAQEMLMPLMHPRAPWDASGRWDSAKEVMFQFEKDGKEYGLAWTHEEIVMDLVKKRNISYRDLPLKIYHFSTKFRNEPRSRAGLLRGIEFLMNDLYSLHINKDDMEDYYDSVSDAYSIIFERMSLKTKIVEASGGLFTKNFTHEFQVLAENGEDTIFYCDKCDWAQNKEIAKVKEGDKCPKCSGTIKMSKSIEVGNIFPFGTYYSEKIGVSYKDNEGKDQPVWLASYGIGTSRLVGTLAEIFNDKDGLMWPASIAPFGVHLINLSDNNKKADEIYKDLTGAGIEVLYDDRTDRAAGEKLTEADLIGIPIRAVISEKTLEKGSIEIKKRSESKVVLVKSKNIISVIRDS